LRVVLRHEHFFHLGDAKGKSRQLSARAGGFLFG
jgi:hypothetical protein